MKDICNADIKRIEEELSQIVWSVDNRSFPRLSDLVVQRNSILYPSFFPGFSKHQKGIYRNVCEFLLAGTEIPLEFRAYHAGPSRQETLKGKGLEFEGHLTHSHLYFSLNLEEVVREYILPEGHEDRVIYTLDLRKTDNARVQIHYDSRTIFNDFIFSLMECYKDSNFLDELIKIKSPFIKYLASFIKKPVAQQKEDIIKKIDNWLEHTTVPFDLKKLERYKTRNQMFVLVPSLVKVLYKS